METAMSDLFDEYPMLVFALEALVALFLLVFIVVWTSSGKQKLTRAHSDRQTPQPQQAQRPKQQREQQ
jgi:hypothetical protein